jgi:hypothetical protein
MDHATAARAATNTRASCRAPTHLLDLRCLELEREVVAAALHHADELVVGEESHGPQDALSRMRGKNQLCQGVFCEQKMLLSRFRTSLPALRNAYCGHTHHIQSLARRHLSAVPPSGVDPPKDAPAAPPAPSAPQAAQPAEQRGGDSGGNSEAPRPPKEMNWSKVSERAC